MRDPRVIAGGLVIGVLVVLYFGYVVVPAARAAALANAPVAGQWLSWTIDIAFPVSMIFAYVGRRGLSAPVLGNRMFPVWQLCVAGLVLLYLDAVFLVPATTRMFTNMLTQFIGTSGWISPFGYWLVWPVIGLIGLGAVGIATGNPVGRVFRSFRTGFS